jgi:transposase
MSSIIRFGLDLAKSSFAICGVDVAERIVLRKTVSRSELLVFLSQQLPAVVAMEYGSGIRHLALS